jgi:hypothetical protein
MITNSINAIVTATLKLLRNWQYMAILAALYALILAGLYLFITTREASVGQIALSFAVAILVPLLFFVLQTISATYTNGAAQPTNLLKRALKNFWKLIIISLPIIALALAMAYGLGKIQARAGIGVQRPSSESMYRRPVNAPGQPMVGKPRLIPWGMVLFNTVWYLLFAVAFPLAMIHLWIAVAREGLKPTLTKIRTVISHAFAPQSVLIYVVGLIVFGGIPYLVLFRATPASKAWLELGVFVVRLALVFVLTLCGWVITMGALSLATNGPTQEQASQES